MKIQEILKIKLQIEYNVEMGHFYHVASKNKKQTHLLTIIWGISKIKRKKIGTVKALRDTAFFIYGDFCKDNVEVRKNFRHRF